MDRTLKVYAKTGHLFAEFVFNSDHPRQATGHYTTYRRLSNDDEDDESKSVYPGMEMDIYLNFRTFDSIDQIRAHDREVVRKELGGDMAHPDDYIYTYEPDPVLLRYIAANHQGCIGVINILFSFVNNTKEVKFLSGTNPRFDFDLSSNSLETNISCISRIPVYTDRDIREINTYDLTRLPPWY